MILPVGAESLALATRRLRSDEVVAFPTETVYGLGGNALSEAAVARIYAYKGRPRHNPLIVHIADVAAARRLAADFPKMAETLAERFWPGPLSIVVRRTDAIPPIVSAGLPTVALRVPAHPAALALLKACELPLAAPSANRSEQVSPTTAEHVARGLPEVGLVLDGGPCRLGIESTVVDLTTSRPRLLRPGALPLRALREVIPDLELPASLTAPSPDAPRAAPGMMARHYAPRAPLTLLPASQAEARTVLEALPAPRGLLSHGEPGQLDALCSVVERLPADAAGYAADLYAALHRLDDREVASIAVVPPPADADDSWYAIRDRLQRAACAPQPAASAE